MTEYALRSRPLVLHDSPERIDFHVRNGDYLAYASTLLGFVEEALARCPGATKERALTEDLRKDLRYAHTKYELRPKD